jgi:cytochrome c556
MQKHRKPVTDAEAVERTLAELRKAREKFPARFNSPHEGFGVLREEVDELWEAVRDLENTDGRLEAAQVAAMAIRFMVECT